MKTLRPLVLTGLAALVASLGGCGESQAPQTQQSAQADASADGGATSVPDAKPGISANDARLVLPAVAGRPGVAYFSVRNDTQAPVTLAGVYVSGVGKSEMHQTSGGKMSAVKMVDIAPGATVTFAPGGLHVMAFDIAGTVQAGTAAEATLTFSDGDKLSLPIKVEAMGAAQGSHR